MTRRVLIIGAGIVGAAIADGLARREGFEVTVIERGPRGGLLGATGHAPGFVTVLSESPVLTELALGSADLYSGLTTKPSGFDRIGGLEVAVTESALGHVERRSRMAASTGIESRILGPEEAATLAPTFVDRETCFGALYFPGDAAARGSVLTGALAARAEQAGAKLRYETACTAFSLRGSRITGLRTSAGERIDADDVVIAAGIWGSQVAALAGVDAPLTPIAHPYVYGPTRPKSPSAPQPFVKWRTETVYARDHGDRFGIGTHTNDGPAVDVAALHEAELPWPAHDFESEIESALQLLPLEHRFGVEERLNGMFSMTADGMPLLGPSTSVDGLWIAGSLWLTHAGGAARVLVDMMSGHAPRIDGLDDMVPERFVGHERDRLTALALKNYRRIWMPAE
jgi:glycine/D-amino acid oxidase-like deaminating enzyme